MSRSTMRTLNVDRLREITHLAKGTSSATAVDVTFAVLDRVRAMIGADSIAFHDLNGTARRSLHLQFASAEEHVTNPSDEGAGDFDDMFWKYYESSSCSLPDRANKPVVFSDRTMFSARELACDPMSVELFSDVYDEILAASPYETDMNLRLLIRRTEGPAFSESDLFLVELLQPHLQPLFRRTLRSVLPAVEPPLTARQRQILSLVREGMTNAQVAHQLDISPGTVRKHLENTYSRLHVQSRVAAVGATFANHDGRLQQA
ncbi:MAG: LuxR C-terminal-related transcriptional regulator [Ornithinimicrobium sp.]